MLTVSFAFVVATGLFFLFRQTRWMGVVGTFILLCISPLFFTCLLVLVAATYYSLSARSTSPPLPRNETSRGLKRLAALLAALAIGGALLLLSSDSPSDSSPSKLASQVRSAPSEDVIVLRTPGGLLEVSRIYATELLDARVVHRVLGIRIGELVPRIRVPAVYRYHIELAPEWLVFRRNGVLTVVVPQVKPTLPVAVDFESIERDVAGTWMLLPWKGKEDLAYLERGVTLKLAQKASSSDYISRQREAARETVREFARKWLVEQTGRPSASHDDIRVLFADEVMSNSFTTRS